MKVLFSVLFLGFMVNVFAFEPTVSKKESLLLSKAALKGKISAQKAIRLIESGSSEKSSAALDYAAAVYLLKIDKTEEAIAKFEIALKKEPLFTRARFSLVRLNIDQLNYASALKQLNLLLDQKSEDSGKILNLIGYCHQMQKHYLAAEQAYKMTLVRDATNLTANRGLVQTLIEQSRFKEAKLILEDLLLADPKNPDLWNLLVTVILEAEGNKKALVKLLTAEKLGVIDESIPVTIASLFFQEQLYSLSARYYLDLMGEGHLSAEKTLEAIKAFLSINQFTVAEKLITNKSGYNKAQLNLRQFLYGRLLIGQRKRDEASQLFKVYTADNPVQVDALLIYADLLHKRGNSVEAEYFLKRAERLEPTNQKVYLSLTQLFIDNGNYDKAIKVLARSLNYKENESIRKFKNNLEHFVEMSGKPE